MKAKSNKPKKLKKLSDWDWTTLVASWRYYEHGHTITAGMFPHEMAQHFFGGDYDADSCMRIACQFVTVDHSRGPDDIISGWPLKDVPSFGNSDSRAWRLLYWFLRAYAHDTTRTFRIVNGNTEGDVECFKADGLWYAVEGYIKFGANVAPYEKKHIKEERK